MEHERCSSEPQPQYTGKGVYASFDIAERSRDAARKQKDRLKNSLNAFLNAELAKHGGADGDMCKTMMVGFFSEHSNILEHLLIELQVYEDIERQTVQCIQQKWDLDACTAMFVYGNMTWEGYQAVLNLLSKEFCDSTETFDIMTCPHGTKFPKLQSKYKLFAHVNEIAKTFGLQQLDDGRAAAIDIKRIIQSRLQVVKRHSDKSRQPLPSVIMVQLAADAAGWRKRPREKTFKNFTALVVKVMADIKRWEADEDGTEVHEEQRVGDSVNSLHNNKVALLYAGKDCYNLLHQYFSAPQGNGPSVLAQLRDITKNGVDVTNDDPNQPAQHVKIIFRGGGDLKWQSDQFGLNGHASRYPCTRCECHRDHIGLSKPNLQQRQHHTVHRCMQKSLMLAHKFGPEWGLEEPYHCPGCQHIISSNDAFAPQSAKDIRDYPSKHYGQYHGLAPLLPVEHWDFVPDLLHAMLRSVINMFFVTVTMNLTSEARAKQLSDFMEAELKVEAVPFFHQGSRASTKKNLQTWAGEECWLVMAGIEQVLRKVLEGRPTAHFDRMNAVWESWFDLYAALLLNDIAETEWEALASIVEKKATAWHANFMMVATPDDVNPTMHEIVCHFGDIIRRHGPLGPFSGEGIEARHQPIKRLCKHHTSRRGAGSTKTTANNTDILQVARRGCVTDYVKDQFPSGKGQRKKKNTCTRDKLSNRLAQLQASVLHELEGAHADEC